MGWELNWRCLHSGELISVMERTKAPSWGQQGGLAGVPNRLVLSYPDGRDVETRKVTGLQVPAGTLVQIRCGGGGGYGPPSERCPDAVHVDLRLGLLSEAAARRYYPQAFA
jgi:N-methylhydantoinase B